MRKYCPRCRTIKDASEFYPSPRGDGLRAYCKLCQADRKREVRSRQPTYHSRPRAPIGPCDICGNTARLSQDHDHSTGLDRGLLCHHCNTGLGLFRDSPKLLFAAMAYLNLHRDAPTLTKRI
jgi:hypothetical protein